MLVCSMTTEVGVSVLFLLYKMLSIKLHQYPAAKLLLYTSKAVCLEQVMKVQIECRGIALSLNSVLNGDGGQRSAPAA
jgi:hypothetical protein